MLATNLSSIKHTMRDTTWEKRALRIAGRDRRDQHLICKNLSGILDNMAPIITEQGLIRCGNRLVPEK